MNISIDDAVTFKKLNWDTDYFGMSCAKATLYEPLDLYKWNLLKSKFKGYDFISIENRNSEPINSQFIGKDTLAFLADVNVQFIKKLHNPIEFPHGVEIFQSLRKCDEILDMVEFGFSKFKEDVELSRRGGDKLYHQWVMNSFGKTDKFFVLSKNEKNKLNGFLLYSYSDNACVIELISVAPSVFNSGIGTKLFKAVECSAYRQGYKEIRVGTQIRNTGAINFYHKVGCKQVGAHEVYHLWN